MINKGISILKGGEKAESVIDNLLDA